MLQLQPSLISSSNFFGSTFSENLFGTRFKQGYDIHIHAVPPKRRCDVNRSASKKNGERSSLGTPPHSLNFRKKSRRNIIADTSIHKECYQNTKKKPPTTGQAGLHYHSCSGYKQDPSHWHQDSTTHVYSLSTTINSTVTNNHSTTLPPSGKKCCVDCQLPVTRNSPLRLRSKGH